MWHDFRQAVRSLHTHPGFVALAVVVLALGIGLNTAVFSVVYAMLFRPLPVEDSSRLASIYMVQARQPDRLWVIHSTAAEFFKKHSGMFFDVTMHWGMVVPVRANDETENVNVEQVFSNYFDVLGVRPALGRPLLPQEDSLGNPERAMVISHALWERRFASDPNIVGRHVTITPGYEADLAFTIVGVMPAGFKGVSEPWKPTQAWVTFAQVTAGERRRIAYAGAAIGRLRPGVTFDEARAAVLAQSEEAGSDWAPGRRPRFVLLRTNDVRVPNHPSDAAVPARLAGAMTIVVAVVLLVAATNIAGMLMARGLGRSGEIAVRRVLGASPLRIVRQLLAESLLLSIAGGVAGLLLAAWLLELLRAFTPLQYAVDVAMEPMVVLFSTALCILAGIVVGVMPARQALKLDILPWLAGSGGLQTKQTRRGLRHAITLPQVALSLVLLLVAGVYVRALLTQELADVGYHPDNVVVARPLLRLQPGERTNRPDGSSEAQYAERAQRFYRQLLATARAIPGAQEVALASGLPLREPAEQPQWSLVSQDDFVAGRRVGPPTERASVSPGYFRTMGMSVTAGRDFDERDTRSAPPVAIVSRALAQRLWPGREAVGRGFTILSSWEASNKNLTWYQVAGVVNDVAPVLHDREVRPFVYFPLGQEWRPHIAHVLVRGGGDSRTLIPAIKGAVASADPLADVARTQTMAQMVNEIFYPRRIAAAILAASGAIALFLATIGIYGVVSYSVAQRTGEIGVRIALGAERRDIVRLVLREGVRIATIGSTAGLVLGYTAIRVTSNRYLALPQLDLPALVLTPLALTAVVLLACYLPARRASAVDAMDVLRRA